MHNLFSSWLCFCSLLFSSPLASSEQDCSPAAIKDAHCLGDHNGDFNDHVNLLQQSMATGALNQTKVHLQQEGLTHLPNGHALDDPCAHSTSWMLLGAIGFLFGIFYLLNFPDDDIQRYSYEIIGTSLDIFIGVLSFDSLNSYIKSLTETSTSGQNMMLLLALFHMLAWITLTQVVLGLLSGAVDSDSPSMSVSRSVAPRLSRQATTKLSRVRSSGTENQQEVDVKCWGGILAHISGFAAMEVCVILQDREWFRQSPVHSLAVVPIAAATIAIIFMITRYIRDAVIQSDGVITHREVLWDEETQEAENDMLCLTISFVLINTLQFQILGELPHEKELMVRSVEMEALRSDFTILFCGSVGIVILILIFAHVLGDLKKKNRLRLIVVSVELLSMCFAWMLLGAAKAVALYAYPGADLLSVDAEIVFALLLTAGSLVIIFFLDKVADSVSRGSEVHHAMVKVILSQGLLVGFSWEQCFFTAVMNVMSSPLSRMGGCLLLSAFVIPAYWWYVDPMIFKARNMQGD